MLANRMCDPKNYPRRESNPHLRFRKPPFYPLNYGDIFQSPEVRDQISDLDPIARGKWSKSRARRLNALVPLVDCGW